MRGLFLAVFLVLPLPLQAQDQPPVQRPVMDNTTRPEPRPRQWDRPQPGVGIQPQTKASPTPAGPLGPPVHAQLRESDPDYSTCLLDLTLLGADFTLEPPVTDPGHRDCGIDRPVALRSPLPGIRIEGTALMRCDTARQLAYWLRDFVRPATAHLAGQPRLEVLEPGSTYQCRATVGNDGENLSEHAFGNGFDIAGFRFSDGSRLPIQPRRDSGNIREAFQRTVRASACLYFTTVLGPGSNAAHDEHLHLDIKARSNGWRLCQ